MLLSELNAADLRVGGYDKAVLAVGATEFHGDHLPYSADTIAAETIARHGLHVAVVGGWQGRARALLAGCRDIALDHAGQSEMSLVLHAAPHLARPEGAAALPNEPTGLPVVVYGDFARRAPHGYTGNPAAGNAEEGAAIVEAIIAQVAPSLHRLDAHGWGPGTWLYE